VFYLMRMERAVPVSCFLALFRDDGPELIFVVRPQVFLPVYFHHPCSLSELNSSVIPKKVPDPQVCQSFFLSTLGPALEFLPTRLNPLSEFPPFQLQ